MYGDPMNPTPPQSDPALSGSPAEAAPEAQRRVDTPQVVVPHARVPEPRPPWVTWFAHPFANWFWFYVGFVAALSGANFEYPGLGPVVIVGWLTGHLVNAKHPMAEIKLLLASMGIGYVFDGLLTHMEVLKFKLHEPSSWWWPIPLWMVMMWPNFAATLNSSMKWLRGRYRIGAILGAIAGPFSYYGGVKFGKAVQFGNQWSFFGATIELSEFWSFWGSMIVIGIEWAFAMPLLLWLSAKWVPGPVEQNEK